MLRTPSASGEFLSPISSPHTQAFCEPSATPSPGSCLHPLSGPESGHVWLVLKVAVGRVSIGPA